MILFSLKEVKRGQYLTSTNVTFVPLMVIRSARPHILKEVISMNLSKKDVGPSLISDLTYCRIGMQYSLRINDAVVDYFKMRLEMFLGHRCWEDEKCLFHSTSVPHIEGRLRVLVA